VIFLSGENEYFDSLLKAYRSIWNNRQLALEEKSCQETLAEAIKRELLDENSHPRIRKSKYEKYYSATKRILSSALPPESKLQLIKLHTEIMEE
jgi:hypothetical protein